MFSRECDIISFLCLFHWSVTMWAAPRENDPVLCQRTDTHTLRTHSTAVWQVWIFIPDCARSITFNNDNPLLPEQARGTTRGRQIITLSYFSKYLLMLFPNPDLFKSTVLFFIFYRLLWWHSSGTPVGAKVVIANFLLSAEGKSDTSHAMTRWVQWLRSKTQFPVKGNGSEEFSSGTVSLLSEFFPFTPINIHLNILLWNLPWWTQNKEA